MSYAARSKYDEPGRAQRYADRSARRNEAEWALVETLLADLPAPRDALDVPCGTGRIAERLIARGVPTRCADLSPAMLRLALGRLGGRAGFEGAETLDLEALAHPPPEPADLVVCLRFLHHLPGPGPRQAVLRSLRVLTRRHLLLSFHHPISLHNLSRLARRIFTGRRGDRYTLSPRALRREAAAAGFAVVRVCGLAPWRREFWLALLRPADGPASA